MRRVRPVCIKVSQNFYRQLEEERKRLGGVMKKYYGSNKEPTLIGLTEMIATRGKIPQVNFKINEKTKDKRRHF